MLESITRLLAQIVLFKLRIENNLWTAKFTFFLSFTLEEGQREGCRRLVSSCVLPCSLSFVAIEGVAQETKLPSGSVVVSRAIVLPFQPADRRDQKQAQEVASPKLVAESLALNDKSRRRRFQSVPLDCITRSFNIDPGLA